MLRSVDAVRDARRQTQWFGAVVMVVALYGTLCWGDRWPWMYLNFPSQPHGDSLKLRAMGDSLEVKISGHGGITDATSGYRLRLNIEVTPRDGLSDVVLYPDSVKVLYEDRPMALKGSKDGYAPVVLGKKWQNMLEFRIKDWQFKESTLADTTGWAGSAHLTIVLDGLAYRNGKLVELGTVLARDFLPGEAYLPRMTYDSTGGD